MRKTILLFTLIGCLGVGLVGSVLSNGLQVLLKGDRQAGIGNLGVALRQDASTVF